MVVMASRDFARLEKRANRNLRKFKKDKCKVLPLGKSNTRHQCMENGFALEILVGTKLGMEQECARVGNKVKDVLGFIRRYVDSRSRGHQEM